MCTTAKVVMRQALVALAMIAAAAAGRTVHAQIVRGTVIDSTTKAPIPGVTIALRGLVPDSSVAVGGAVTDSLGQFSVKAPEPGIYMIAARKLGYVPLAGPAKQLDSGDVRVVRFEMATSTVILDSVLTTATRAANNITPGQAYFSRHYAEGKGMFFGGLDIVWSKLRACDYLAKLPGLTYSPSVAGITGIRCEPEKTLVTSNNGARCLAGRVDHSLKIEYVDSSAVYVKQRGTPADAEPIAIPFIELRGIEVYRTRDELPKDFSIPTPDEMAALSTTTAAARGTNTMTVDATAIQGCVWVQIWTAHAW